MAALLALNTMKLLFPAAMSVANSFSNALSQTVLLFPATPLLGPLDVHDSVL